jgi:2-polyprenyl-6-methoxyphenol hydroxylase-like FAD-dependent oxidoreductase
MESSANKGAIIIGGGVGGLCAAIALRQAGIEATVFERASHMVEIGAGLSLWANAMRVFDKLGLGQAVREVSVPGTLGEIRTWRGELLSEIESAKLARKYGAAHIALHRADLQAVLLRALGSENVRLGARCMGFRQDRAGVTAFFADGRQARGSFLVGADGIHSAIRAQLTDKNEPVYAGYVAWRGVTPFEDKALPPGVGIETWGKGRRFGVTHISRGRVYWFATKNTRKDGQDGPAGRKGELLQLFRGWHQPVAAIIEATREEAILRNDIFEHRHLRRWGKGRVTMLGDAAHAMTPNLGQGACQAVEDALVLARCLGGEDDVATALRHYEARRIPWTTAVAWQSRLTGRFSQVENPLACRLRNTLTKRTPAFIRLKQLEWIVGYEA